MTKPLLRWVGGKSKIAKHIIPIIQSANFIYYNEPFFGGGAVFFKLAPPQRSCISDSNPDLINFYQVVKDEPEELFAQTNFFLQRIRTNGQKAYYELRSINYNLLHNPILAAAQFYALNKLCFNGLYRTNQRGKFNVPMGKFKTFPSINLEHILEVSDLLKPAQWIESDSFKEYTEVATNKDLFYLDPPYYSEDKTSFTSYTKTGFGLKDHVNLASEIFNLAEKGAKFVLSNSDTPWVRYTYAPFKIQEVYRGGNINSNASDRKPVKELIIHNI